MAWRFFLIMKNTILLIIYITITTFCLCSCTDSKYLEKAAILAKQNDYQAALSILENKIHVKDNPKYLIAHGLCCSNIAFPRYRDAIKDFDALRYTEYGKGTKSLYLLATWSYYINEYEDVINYVEKALEFPEDETIMTFLLFMAESYYHLGKYEDSLNTYSKMIQYKDVTLVVKIDYHKVLSIINNHDYLSDFWESLNLENQTQKEKETLTYYYAKALLEIGKTKEALRYFETLKDPDVDKKLIESYKHICMVLINRNNLENDDCMYIKDMEDIMNGAAIVYLTPPYNELIKLSALYFYILQDYKRCKTYCTQWVRFENEMLDITISDIEELKQYLKIDRLFYVIEEQLNR